MDPNYNPFLEAFQQVEQPAVSSPVQRGIKLLRKGATLGLTDRDIEARGLVEHAAEFAGSIPTIVGTTAALGPVVGPAAGALRLGALGTKLLTAGATGAVVGGVEGLGTGENIVESAVKSAGGFMAGEAVGLAGLKALNKLRGATGKPVSVAAEVVTEATPEAAAKTAADNVITRATETPSPAVVDALTTKVPDVPTIKAYAPTAPGQPDISTELMPTMAQLEKYGPKISAGGLDAGGESADRIPFKSMVQEVTPLWQPVPAAPFGPGLTGDAEARAIRTALAEKIPSKILDTAQTMDAGEFAKYATDPTVASAISEAGTNPSALWRAVQLTQSLAPTMEKQFAVSSGQQPFFQEVFDQALGKKVLVPINKEAELAIQAMKISPSPRYLGLQFEPEQLGYLSRKEGQAVLKGMDVAKRNEPLLTSNIINKSEDEIAKIVEATGESPINIAEPTIIKMGKDGEEALALRRKTGLADNEIDRLAKAAQAAGGDLKEIQKAIVKKITELGGCK